MPLLKSTAKMTVELQPKRAQNAKTALLARRVTLMGLIKYLSGDVLKSRCGFGLPSA
jgi:hypothetical protein